MKTMSKVVMVATLVAVPMSSFAAKKSKAVYEEAPAPVAYAAPACAVPAPAPVCAPVCDPCARHHGLIGGIFYGVGSAFQAVGDGVSSVFSF